MSDSVMLKTTCNTCGAAVAFPDLKVGPTIPCPNCGESVSTSILPTKWKLPSESKIAGTLFALLSIAGIWYTISVNYTELLDDALTEFLILVGLDIVLLLVSLHFFGVFRHVRETSQAVTSTKRYSDEDLVKLKLLHNEGGSLARPRYAPTPRKKFPVRKVIVYLFQVLVCFLIISFIRHTGIFRNDPKMDAYIAAKNFALQSYPGAKTIAPYDQSTVTFNGGVYCVDFLVTGVNLYNAPVRNLVEVQETGNGKTWTLVSIDQL